MSGEVRLLIEGCQKSGIELSDTQAQALLGYVDVLFKWNKVYNLTAIRDRERMISRHLLDSLSVLPHLPEGSVLDVGTGAGLPGIPLGLMRPEQSFTLLDSNGKKTRFVTQAAITLGLKNVKVSHTRIEAYAADSPHQVVISRAFRSLETFVDLCGAHCAEGGVLLAMLGKLGDWQLGDRVHGFEIQKIEALTVYKEIGERHAVLLQRCRD